MTVASFSQMRRTRPASVRISFPERCLLIFIIADFAFQMGMWLFGNTPLRLPMRIGIYGLSFGLMFYLRGEGNRHPASRFIPLIIAVLLISCLNPSGDTFISRGLQVALYVAVIAPLIWMGSVRLSFGTFRLVVLIMWTFYTASAVIGVLQVQYPGQFDGATSQNYSEASLLPHIMTLANGAKIIRPKGLTDVPGGAAAGGVSSIILGVGILLTESSLLLRAISIAGMATGLFCIYVCQQRINLIIVGLVFLAVLVLLARRGDFKRLTQLIVICSMVVFIGTTTAFAIGGTSTIDRFNTLIADDPRTVVYANRGRFLDDMLSNDIWNYPAGAGLGRWGMMNVYFGGAAPPLWAEMMWQALLYDGGIPLVGLYVALLSILLFTAWRFAAESNDQLGCWAIVIFGYTFAAVAASFVFPIFSMQSGMEVVLLNASLFALARELNGTGPLAWKRLSRGRLSDRPQFRSGQSSLHFNRLTPEPHPEGR